MTNKIILFTSIIISILILGVFVLTPVFASSVVIDTDKEGNPNVGPGNSLTITNGATLTGNVQVNGGTLLIELDGTVTGNIKVKNGGILIIDNANVNGNIQTNNSKEIKIEKSNIDGKIGVRNSQNITIFGNTIRDTLKINNSNNCDISSNLVIGQTTLVDSCVEIPVGTCNPNRPQNCLYTPHATFDFDTEKEKVKYLDFSGQYRELNIAIKIPQNIQTKQPVVIWMHGGPHGKSDPLTSMVGWSDLAAKAGYVSVAIAHTSRTMSTIPDMCDALGLLDCQGFGYLGWDRPNDLSAVLYHLVNDFSQTHPKGHLLDLDNIAVGGHSAGAKGAMLVAGGTITYFTTDGVEHEIFTAESKGEDFSHPRPKAFLAFSPQGTSAGWVDTSFKKSNTSWSEITRPMLTITSDGDSSCDPNPKWCTSGNAPSSRKMPIDRMPEDGNKFRLYINDADADHTMMNLNPEKCLEKIDHTKCKNFTNWLSSTGIAFLDTYLRNDSVAEKWLRSHNIEVASEFVSEWDMR